MSDGTAPAATLDRFLGGRLLVEQPARGAHRAGLDAILLAALVPSGSTGRLADLGAGVGTAGLAAAMRSPDLDVVLAERDEAAAAFAARNAERVRAAGHRGTIAVALADVTGPEPARAAAGLGRESFDWVIANPPYFAPGRVRASPAAARAAAHVLPGGALEPWLRAAAGLARPGGRLGLIFRGDALADILDALAGRFGAAAIVPVHPRAGAPAHRLLVSAVKGSRAAPAILPGLVLHPEGSNAYLPEADAILRGERGL